MFAVPSIQSMTTYTHSPDQPCVAGTAEYTATFWLTFHYNGKIRGWGGARSPPFTLSTIMCKVVVYAPAEREDTRPHFSSTPIFTCTLWLDPSVSFFYISPLLPFD